MAKEIRIEEVHLPRELVNWIRQQLSDKWQITVGENTDCDWRPEYGASNSYFWAAYVRILSPVYVSVYFHEKTLPKLVRRVGTDQLKAVREELEKLRASGDIVPVDVIESHRPALGRQTLAIESKPLALS